MLVSEQSPSMLGDQQTFHHEPEDPGLISIKDKPLF
jgi:hypothetical protein